MIPDALDPAGSYLAGSTQGLSRRQPLGVERHAGVEVGPHLVQQRLRRDVDMHIDHPRQSEVAPEGHDGVVVGRSEHHLGTLRTPKIAHSADTVTVRVAT